MRSSLTDGEMVDGKKHGYWNHLLCERFEAERGRLHSWEKGRLLDHLPQEWEQGKRSLLPRWKIRGVPVLLIMKMGTLDPGGAYP